MRALRKVLLAKDESGIAAVEFALALPIVLAFLAFIYDGGRMYWTKNSLRYAIDEGSRVVMLNPSMTDQQLTDSIVAKVAGLSTTGISVTIATSSVSGTNYKTLTASLPFSGLLPGFSGMTISARATVPVI